MSTASSGTQYRGRLARPASKRSVISSLKRATTIANNLPSAPRVDLDISGFSAYSIPRRWPSLVCFTMRYLRLRSVGSVMSGTRSTASSPKASMPTRFAGLLVSNPHLLDAKVYQDLSAEPIVARVGREA